jgi:putative oxidoreductase
MINKVTQFRYHKAWGMLLIRLAAGVVFLNHGWMKVNNLAGAEGFFGTLGLPPGAATFVALIEVVGGLMLILGIAPRLAGLVLGIEMLVALVLVSVPNGVYELELMLAAAALAIFLAGAGRLSLYSMERD